MKLHENRLSQLSARFNLMVMLVFGLLIANMLLASLVWYTTCHKTIEVTPFFGGDSYRNSATTVDAHYLSLMSENFIYSRLNVTPETVRVNYQRLLDYVDSNSYADMLKRLNQEAKIIQDQKISSSFVITDIKVNQLTVDVSGILQRHVGLRAIPAANLIYRLSYRYRLGHLTIIRFTQIKTKETPNV